MLNVAAIAGPGASIRPAVSTSSPQTPVVNSTPESSIAAKPTKKMSEAATAMLNPRMRTIAGSMTGDR